METEEVLSRKFAVVLPILNERQRRIYLASEAEALGRGGSSLVARVSGVARSTIHGALDDSGPDLPVDRCRKSGGGRKKAIEIDPEVVRILKEIVDPETRGDPMSPLLWTSKSTRHLAKELKERGHAVSHNVVAQTLRSMGFSLQAMAKTREGKDHPDRDKQFKYLNKQVKAHQKAGQPEISVDTKKKEKVGNYKNGGQELQPKGEPVECNTHDFEDKLLGKAVPYGVYDLSRNEGMVNVGRDHDTSAFAVESIRRWWYSMGAEAYPDASELLITADGGGSNGHRVRLWKVELSKFAAETGLKITVCHFPPGTSKWNKIEHRMFSHIAMNWRGRPLLTHEVVVNLIGSTTTRQGLTVRATHDHNKYPRGLKIPDKDMKALPIVVHKFHSEWNYTIAPPSSGD